MKKKTMLLALAAVSAALFALPAVASAGTWHLEPTSNFTIAGGTAQLTSSLGTISCTSVTGTGKYDAGSTTTGKIELTFHGCFLGATECQGTNPATTPGTITTTELPFHNVVLDVTAGGVKDIGVLITPGNVTNVPEAGYGHYATFKCGFITVQVNGNGILGQVVKPKCGETSASGEISFESQSTGVQKWTQITTTGTKYQLKANGGLGWVNASQDGSGTTTFVTAGKVNCT